MSKNIYIAFCESNKSIAESIDKSLSNSGFNFQMLSSEKVSGDKSLTALIAESGVEGLLLLSDNLLKDEHCMNHMLNFIQNSAIAEKMQIVVVDGQYETGDVETVFDRVSNVIQYMNYWQERYLDMRKQKRSIQPADEDAFNVRLQNVKLIASEVGDFLRLVRNKEYWSYEQLNANGFEVFFKKFASTAEHQAFLKKNQNVVSKPAPTPTPLENTPEKVTQPITDNNTQPLSINDRYRANISDSKPSESPQVTSTPMREPEVASPVVPAAAFISETVANMTEMEAIPMEEVTEQVADAPKSINEELAVNQQQAQQTVEVTETIEEEKIEIEEKQIEEVLQGVDFVDTKRLDELNNQISELPTLGKRLEIENKIINENPVNEVFEKEHDQPEIVPPAEPAPEFVSNVINNDVDSRDEFVAESLEAMAEENITEEMNITEVSTEDEIDVMEGMEVEDDVEEVAFDESEYEQIYFDDELNENLETDEVELVQEEVETESKPEALNGFIDTPEEPVVDVVEEDATWQAANNLIRKGDFESGTTMYESLLVRNPADINLNYQFGVALMQDLGNFEKAQNQFEKVVQLDFGYAPAYRSLGEIAEHNNDYLLAKSYYEKAVYLAPNSPEVHYKLGLIIAGFYTEKPKAAAKHFKNAFKYNPTFEDAFYRYGLLQAQQLKNDKKARKAFEQLIQINPEHAFGYFELAKLYKRSGDYEESLQAYETACGLNEMIKTEEHDQQFEFTEHQLNGTYAIPENAYLKPLNTDKTILITGATSGIGKATAMLFAQHGFRLILTGRRDERLKSLKKEFEKDFGIKVKTLRFDVRHKDEAKSLIDNLGEPWSKIDVLINNAGLAKGFAPIHEANIDHWETMIDTNIKGLLYLTRAVAPHMVKRKSGHIINVCSTAGKEVYPNGNVYCATKHAVDALTKAMRLDLYQHNIRVGQVSPAHVEETEFAYVRFEDADKAKIYNDFQPLKSSDVADAIFYIVNTPHHVNVQDILLMGTQQANSTNIDRSGR